MEHQQFNLTAITNVQVKPATDNGAIVDIQSNEPMVNTQQKAPTPMVYKNTSTLDTPKVLRKYPRLTDLLNRIPVTGLHDFLQATTKVERRTWAVILLTSVGATLFYFIPCILQFIQFQVVIERNQITNEKPQFPPVFVCANGAINGTFLWNQIYKFIETAVKDSWVINWQKRQNISLGEVIYQLTGYITNCPSGEPWFNQSWVHVFNRLIYNGIQTAGTTWPGIKTFYEEGQFKCEQVLQECMLNGRRFPCCFQTSSLGFAATTCYKLNIPKDMEMLEGKPSQLTIRALIDEQHMLNVFWDVASFSIHFGEAFGGLFGVVYGIPAGAVASIYVTAKKRQRLKQCNDKFKPNATKHQNSHPLLKQYFQEMVTNQNYSVLKCMQANMIELFSQACGCVPHYETMAPEDTVICTPAHFYSCFYTGFQRTVGSSSVKGSAEEKAAKDMIKMLKDQLEECIPLCQEWQYNAKYTFAPIRGRFGNTATQIHNEFNIIMEPEFIQETDVWKIDLVSFFAAIGDGLGFALGLSAVSFVQAVVWVCAAICLIRGRRRVSPGHIVSQIASSQMKMFENLDNIV